MFEQHAPRSTYSEFGEQIKGMIMKEEKQKRLLQEVSQTAGKASSSSTSSGRKKRDHRDVEVELVASITAPTGAAMEPSVELKNSLAMLKNEKKVGDGEAQDIWENEQFKIKDVIAGTALGETLQLALHPPRDPVNYQALRWMALSQSKAEEGCWVDCCATCGTGSVITDDEAVYDQGRLIYCTDCGEGYHPFCVSGCFPLASMDALTRLMWRCVNCKVRYVLSYCLFLLRN
jgi:hypothetical protein